ncbi:fatty-acid--CoA ligase [Nocardia neocaledoniensis NBRC 108232]|uniref:Acyl-CoA synthetase n=1 Tax=Nocardia neocaledoniensis TaxID=236511 RepID=A0A317NIM8_9NOCA|nr:AMP-dependent synthetase/ligase [Nocardia neocaledoniensis]PWV74950.1 long-subunit acyl-CoA synthetase (AMP-forming) [Nocardia neocaledoniensis]GEM30986.1 fatty-acid--CoA ligase [Nocardia neocaledoniensis NBRC 108232]
MNTISQSIDTVCAAFQLTKTVDPGAVAIRTPQDVISVTWHEYDRRVRAVAEGLHAYGVRPGDVVAMMMRNRPEFAWIDCGAMHLGATTLSVYNTSAPEQLAYVLEHSGAQVLLCEQAMLDTVQHSGVRVEHLVSVEGPDPRADLTLEDLQATTSPGFDFDATWRNVRPDDTATLIYTSGTSGTPKAVPISHSNIMAAAQAIGEVVPMHFGDSITSFMPAAHIADRVSTLYWMAIHGIQVTYVDDPKFILPALVDTRPTLWFAVPRIWEKFRAALETLIDSETDDEVRETSRRAIEFGRQTIRARQNDSQPPVVSDVERRHLENMLSRLRATLGLDRTRAAVCGSAPIAADTLEFFSALGIPIIEVWGMTETTGIGTINPPHSNRLGTVGIAMPGNEIRLADDGELLIRGPVCFSGYRGAPELTGDALDADGWVHTGDIAEIDDNGYVRIVDRKKEILINAAGKNMSPAHIENTIKTACPLIACITVIGDGRPFNVALITLDPDAAIAAARQLGIADHSLATLASNSQIHEIVAAGVDKGNASLSRVEQIKRHIILNASWDPGGDELTPTMKLRRKQITEKYRDHIEFLYNA